MGREGEKGSAPKGGKSVPRREEASTPRKGRSTGRVKEEFVGGVEEES